jgi:amino acid transporter
MSTPTQSSSSPPKTEIKPTLGLTGLTINAMALIAPGAFLWLTYQEQSLYGAPMAGAAMWLGIVFALVLCFATAISYAELSKLYPGAGSSYLYAEQAFLSKTKAFKWARMIKFFTGWNSHLYYWIYTGLMVGVTAILADGWRASCCLTLSARPTTAQSSCGCSASCSRWASATSRIVASTAPRR